MLSDDSSSDSETGRFKCKSKPEEDKKSEQKHDSRSSGRNRRSENERFHRAFDRRRDDRDHSDRGRDKFRHSRYSPVNRRRRSREGSPVKRSHERRHSQDRSLSRRSHERRRVDRDSASKSKIRDHRSSSKDRHRHSRSRSHLKTVDHKKDAKEELKRNSREVTPNKFNRKARESISLSPEPKSKRSEIFKPSAPLKRKSDSPVIIVDEAQASSDSEEVQPGSYYNMIPAVVKDKSEESSEIDSSDDEKLRAKLLNLEKKLSKTKKKKHRKKHKRKNSKSKERENDGSLSVEVSSTTDIKEKILESPKTEPVPEVTSTQKTASKESSEEGEILSDDDFQKEAEIDASDLRHKLKRSRLAGSDDKMDVCGPALPPHLQGRFEKHNSLDMEGPALPPRLQSGPRNIGPSIPDDMRKILAEKEHDTIKYESSDDDHNMGPLPEGAEGKWSDAHKRLEQRAMAMKIRQLEGRGMQGSEVKSREKWMLELPEAKAKYLGLEARTFRAKEGPDMSDRSSWTDTPKDKAKKAAGQVNEDPEVVMKREAKARQIAHRDNEQEEAVKKHKKKHKREESLLELHQKKQKKKKKKEENEDGKKERRPFNREVDMQVNRFDEAQKKSIIKKAQNLDGRFSSGEAKFL